MSKTIKTRTLAVTLLSIFSCSLIGAQSDSANPGYGANSGDEPQATSYINVPPSIENPVTDDQIPEDDELVDTRSAEFLLGLVEARAGNIDAAFSIWKPLADAGDVDAQYGLSLLYESGEGSTFSTDLGKTVSLLKEAAAAGLKEAQTNLGLLYAEGRGVEQNSLVAALLWQAAAQSGHEEAQFNLALAYYEGSGVPQNLSEAVSLAYTAAANGLPEAQYAYGQLLRLGLGTEQSDGQALYWLEQAAAAGNPDAPALIAEIKEQGEVTADVETDPAFIPALAMTLRYSKYVESYTQSLNGNCEGACEEDDKIAAKTKRELRMARRSSLKKNARLAFARKTLGKSSSREKRLTNGIRTRTSFKGRKTSSARRDVKTVLNRAYSRVRAQAQSRF